MNFTGLVMKRLHLSSMRRVVSLLLAIMLLSTALFPAFAGAADPVDITKDGFYSVPITVFRETAVDLSHTSPSSNVSTANSYCSARYIKTTNGVPSLLLNWTGTTASFATTPVAGTETGFVAPTDFKYFANSDFTGAETPATTLATHSATHNVLSFAPGMPPQANGVLYPAGHPFAKEISFPIPAYALTGDTFVAMSMNIFGMPATAYQKAKVKLYLDEVTPIATAVEQADLTKDGWYKVPASIVMATSDSTSMANDSLVSPVYVQTKGGALTLYTQWTPINMGLSWGYLSDLKYYPGGTWGETPQAVSVVSYQYNGA